MSVHRRTAHNIRYAMAPSFWVVEMFRAVASCDMGKGGGLVEGVHAGNVEGFAGVGVPHLFSHFAVGVIELVVRIVRGGDDVRVFAGFTIGQPIFRVVDGSVSRYAGGGEIVGVNFSPFLACGFTVIIFDDVGRTLSGVFDTAKFIGNLLDDAGVEAEGTYDSCKGRNEITEFHVCVMVWFLVKMLTGVIGNEIHAVEFARGSFDKDGFVAMLCHNAGYFRITGEKGF